MKYKGKANRKTYPHTYSRNGEGELYNGYIMRTLLKALGGMTLLLSLTSGVLAASTSNFTQTINAGTLAVDIVDGSYDPVASPSVTFSAVTFDFGCQTSIGALGTATEQIYVVNPDAADAGWTLSIAADGGATDLWDSAGTDFDFNDPTSAGCTDGADADSFGGQLSIDPSGGTLAAGQCASCTTANLTLGSSSAFSEGVTDSITLITAAAGSDDIGDWTLQDIDLSQTIPAEQPAANDYDIDMTLSVVAS